MNKQLRLLALLSLFGPACGKSADDAITSTSQHSALWPPSATKLVAESSGGYVMASPIGSECTLTERTYTVEVATKTLAWKACAGNAAVVAPFRWKIGSRVLADADYAAVQKAIAALTVVTEAACGADKPTLKATITAGGDEKTYYDAFYICQGGGKTYVTGMGELFSKLRSLVTDDLDSSGTPSPDAGTPMVKNDGGTSEPDGAVVPGAIWTADVTKVIATSKGGYPAPPVQGSTCTPADTTLTLDLARTLTWSVCQASGPTAPHMRLEGNRVLTAAEFDDVKAAVNAIRVVTDAACGADKPDNAVSLETGAGTRAYYDAFHICKGGGKTYAEGVDEVLVKMRQLAVGR